eukprot:2878991-Prymnesium_polylepis.1
MTTRAPDPAMSSGRALSAAAKAAEAAGDKAWYFKQHEASAAARGQGRLLRREPAVGGEGDGALWHELWLDGTDLVGLTV